MTIGVTGVVWTPRGALTNATALGHGAGAAPLEAAGAAWTAVAEGFGDAAVTLARVLQQLGAGWEGAAAAAVLGRLAPFADWSGRIAGLAGVAAATASAEAGAYSTATLAMPSLSEITSGRTARTAAYSLAGVVDGAAAAADDAGRALDIRAGRVMEAYEAAAADLLTAHATVPAPPPLTTGAGAGPATGIAPGDVHGAAAPGEPSATVAARTASTAVPGPAVPDGPTPSGSTDTAMQRSGTGAGTGTGHPVTGAPFGAFRSPTSSPFSNPFSSPFRAPVDHPGREDGDRPGPQHRPRFEHFADGRTVVPSVLGAALTEDGP